MAIRTTQFIKGGYRLAKLFFVKTFKDDFLHVYLCINVFINFVSILSNCVDFDDFA